MNTIPEYSLKRQINLIFVLIGFYNFIKDYLLQDIDYFEVENNNFIVPFNGSDNLLLSSFIVTFIQINKKKNIIANAMWVNYTSYVTQRCFII